MNSRYQDAMAIVRKFGKPDLFITMTCNPKWVEITRELNPGQTAQDRCDLCLRVFQLTAEGFPQAHEGRTHFWPGYCARHCG